MQCLKPSQAECKAQLNQAELKHLLFILTSSGNVFFVCLFVFGALTGHLHSVLSVDFKQFKRAEGTFGLRFIYCVNHC